MLSLGSSGSPGVDALIKAAQALVQEPELKSTLQFSRHVEELQVFRRSMEKQFRDSLRYYPRSPLLQQLEGQLDEEFERFRAGARRLESYLEKSQVEDLKVGCQRVHQSVIQLQSLSSQLRAQEEVWKQQYEPGLAGELKFLIEQTLRGAIPYQQAALALDKSLEACRELERAMGKVEPESEFISENLDLCTVELANFGRCLQRASQSLRMQHSWEVEERLSDLLLAVAELSKVHAQLMQALYPPVICPRCGVEQPGDRPQCSACSARLPLAAAWLLPPPPSPEVKARFHSFVEIEDKLEQWLRGEVDTAPCETAIDQFRQRLLQGRRQMEKDDRLDQQQKELMVQAASTADQALSSLKQSMMRHNHEACERELQALRQAEELMIRARERAEQLQSTPNS
jgi:hypothetical protein